MSGDQYDTSPWVASVLAWLRFAAEILAAMAVGLIVADGAEELFEWAAR